jgi:hypothetical protein
MTAAWAQSTKVERASHTTRAPKSQTQQAQISAPQ